MNHHDMWIDRSEHDEHVYIKASASKNGICEAKLKQIPITIITCLQTIHVNQFQKRKNSIYQFSRIIIIIIIIVTLSFRIWKRGIEILVLPKWACAH